MLMDFINKKYEIGEPIFLSELPYSSQDALRQEMKKLTDEGKLVRIYNGVYYKPFRTILGTKGKMSINKFVEKKFLRKDDKIFGFLSGISLYNKYGFTSQIPAVIEVTSNIASTKQRKIEVDDYNIVVYKPLVEINEFNINEIEFLTMMIDIDKYCEVYGLEYKSKLSEYVTCKNLDFNLIKQYLPLFPDRVYRNIYNGGLMNELV